MSEWEVRWFQFKWDGHVCKDGMKKLSMRLSVGKEQGAEGTGSAKVLRCKPAQLAGAGKRWKRAGGQSERFSSCTQVQPSSLKQCVAIKLLTWLVQIKMCYMTK